MTTTTAPKFIRIVRITDDVTTCDCCGKTGLKRTVLIEVEINGETFDGYYGTTCAANQWRFLGDGARVAKKAQTLCPCGCAQPKSAFIGSTRVERACYLRWRRDNA